MRKYQLKKSYDFDNPGPLITNTEYTNTTQNLKNPVKKSSNYSNNITPLHTKPSAWRPSTVISTKARSKSNDLKPDRLYTGSIEEYSLGPTLGFGAYAIVKQATHTPTATKFALKTYEKIKLLEPQRKKNLISEIKVLKSLTHPNIIKIKEAIDCPKQIHIVMEYVGGCSLWSYLKKSPNRVLPEPTARKYFTQIISGLNYCHSVGVIHRDLKLENILLDSTNTVKIIDFGFATFSRPPEYTRLFCGTPSYMAPEIVGKKENPGAAADVWAAGVLLFVMLTGNYPFKSTSDRELYRLILKGKFDFPIGISQTVKNLLRKILQTDPRKRPSCAQILKDPWVLEARNTINRDCNFGDISFQAQAGIKSSTTILYTQEDKENFKA